MFCRFLTRHVPNTHSAFPILVTCWQPTSPRTGDRPSDRQQLRAAAAPASEAVGPPAAGGSRLVASCGASGGLGKRRSGGSKARVLGAAAEGAVAGHLRVLAGDVSDPALVPGETGCWLCFSFGGSYGCFSRYNMPRGTQLWVTMHVPCYFV